MLRRAALALALTAGCDIQYRLQDPSFRDAGYWNPYRSDGRLLEAGSLSARAGEPCVSRLCAAGLRCLPFDCAGLDRRCVDNAAVCPPVFALACDCTGATVLNRCVAYVRGYGLDHEGPCRAPADGGALDAHSDDAPAIDVPTGDGPEHPCARTTCGTAGSVCCAEPASANFGTCQPERCAECCGRGR